MNFKRLSHIYLSSILLAACSDDVPVEPGQLKQLANLPSAILLMTMEWL